MGAEIVMSKVEKPLEFMDKAGRPLMAGDLITYAVSYGRSPGLSYGKVLALTKGKSTWRPNTKTKVRVQGVDRPWGGIQVKKPGVLEYSERMLKIERHQVPEDILAKLDTISVEE